MKIAKHFHCTACGKCCYGLLPLTIKDAFEYSSLFPICFVWSAVRESSKDFEEFSKLGAIVKLPGNKRLAVSIFPASYMPSSYPCPALKSDNLCSMHLCKPLRCKTMPFFPYREERFQDELISLRDGWLCDISSNAPLVFENYKIIDRENFDLEKKELILQVPLLRQYCEYMIKYLSLIHI